MRSERKNGFSAEPVLVSAYVGSSKKLKDLRDLQMQFTATGGFANAFPHTVSTIICPHAILIWLSTVNFAGKWPKGL